MLIGLYHDEHGWIRVQNVASRQVSLIPKIQYVASGSTPPFTELPTREEYEARMPAGSQGRRRPADVIGNAFRVMRIATGEEDDTIIDDAKGARKRAKTMTPERRAEIAKKAAEKRWGRSSA